jgi:hypothetical protein
MGKEKKYAQNFLKELCTNAFKRKLCRKVFKNFAQFF